MEKCILCNSHIETLQDENDCQINNKRGFVCEKCFKKFILKNK